MRYLAIIFLVLIMGCASSSEHYKVKKVIEGQVVDVDVIKQRGIIKAKHPTGAEGESKPWLQFPSAPPIKLEQ